MLLKSIFISLIGILLAFDVLGDPFDGVKDAQKSQSCITKVGYILQSTFTNRTQNFNITTKKLALKMKVITHFQKPGYTDFGSKSIVEVQNTIFARPQWINAFEVDGEVLFIDLNHANKEPFDTTTRMVMIVKKNDLYSIQLIKEVTSSSSEIITLFSTKDVLDFVQLPKLKSDHQNMIMFGSLLTENFMLLNLNSGEVKNIYSQDLKNGKMQNIDGLFLYGHFESDKNYLIQMGRDPHRSPLTYTIPKN